MRRRARSILAAGALMLGGVAVAPVAQAEGAGATGAAGADAGADAVKVFNADVTKEQITLLAAGQDAHEMGERAPEKGTARVELFLTDAQAKDLAAKGVRNLTERKVSAKAESRIAAAGDGVYRPYSGKGNLQEEIVKTGQAHSDLTKVVSIGKTLQGKDILALKLSKGAKKSKDGAKPSVLYLSNQHAREWS